MSPEIQERLHKSRSRINNLYLLTRPIEKQCRSETEACYYVELDGVTRTRCLWCVYSRPSRRTSCRNRSATRLSVHCSALCSTLARTTRASVLNVQRTNSTKFTRSTRSASPCQLSYAIRRAVQGSGFSRKEPRKLS